MTDLRAAFGAPTDGVEVRMRDVELRDVIANYGRVTMIDPQAGYVTLYFEGTSDTLSARADVKLIVTREPK